jgi:hypothetical protein
MYERQLLRELEALRADVSSAAKKAVPPANGVPKPSIIPPLEAFSDRNHLESAPSAPLENGFQKIPHTQPPHTASVFANNGGPQGSTPHKLPSQPQIPQSPLPSPFPQTPLGRQEPMSAVSVQSFSSARGPFSPSVSQHIPKQPLPPQSPGAGPSSPAIPPERQPVSRPVGDEAPLGGSFVDGTKSMFVSKSTSSPRPSPLSVSSSTSNIPAPFDPLRNDSYKSSLHNGPSQQTHETDPLGSIRPHQMSSSVRVPPTRPKLDAREAASKLANMF